MTSRIARHVLPIALVTFLALAATTPVQAAVVTNISVPISLTVFIPCAGESVTLTGDLHILFSVESDSNGGMHVDMHFQPQGVSGTGSVTGDKYQGTGVTRTQFNVQPPFPFEFTLVNNFRIIGQGGHRH